MKLGCGERREGETDEIRWRTERLDVIHIFDYKTICLYKYFSNKFSNCFKYFFNSISVRQLTFDHVIDLLQQI